jgi:WD40 repeat protein
VYALAIVDNYIVSGDSAGFVHSYDLDKLTRVHSRKMVERGEQNVWSVTAMPDRKWVATGNSDGVVRIWDPAADRIIGRSAAPDSDEARSNPTLNTVAYSSERQRIAASGDGKQVVEYDVRSLDPASPKQELPVASRIFGQEGTVWMAAYSKASRWLAFGGLDGFARLVDLPAVDHVMKDPAETLARGTRDATGR